MKTYYLLDRAEHALCIMSFLTLTTNLKNALIYPYFMGKAGAQERLFFISFIGI